MTLLGPHAGETFVEHQEHLRLDFVLGSPRRAPIRPLLAWIFAIAFSSSCLTLALSAATSAVSRSVLPPVEAADVAAVRAEVPRARREDRAPASESSEAVESVRPSGFTTQASPARDDPATIIAIIHNAFADRGLDVDVAVRVATCESTLNPRAIGDGGAAVGLWQWHLPSWNQWARRLYGRDVGDLRADPVASSLVTAYTVSRQGWAIWSCQP